jgi:hypothetical protein
VKGRARAFTIYYLLSTICYLLLAICYLLSAICYLLSAICYWLLAIGYWLLAIRAGDRFSGDAVRASSEEGDGVIGLIGDCDVVEA